MKTEFNVIGRKYVFLSVSGVLIVAAIAAILMFGFREGIDFSGGTFWQFRAGGGTAQADLEQYVRNELGIADARVSYNFSGGSYFVRSGALAESSHREYLEKLKVRFPEFEELSFESIGPSIGKELRTRAYWAIVLVLLGISLYIAFAFRKVSRPVSSWKYGIVTLASLFHDVIIPAGMLAILGRYAQVEIDSNFIVALLVVMGFSVHDTIVVFDRIRENLILNRGKHPFGAVINQSINQTLGRSINTSLTLILVLLALLFAGPASLWYFILTLLVGVSVGIYSSIFFASPLLLLWHAGGEK